MRSRPVSSVPATTVFAVWALMLAVAVPVFADAPDGLELAETGPAVTPDSSPPPAGSTSTSTRSAYGPWDKSLDEKCRKQKRAYQMTRVMLKREARLYGRPPKALPPFECRAPGPQP